MKFGVCNFNSVVAGQSRAARMLDWADLCVEAEKLGFWSAWLTEHHFGSDRTYRPYGVSEADWPTTDYDMSVDPLTMLSFAAGRTSRLRLGTGVVILHWDHPIRVAERAATVDILSGGRLELGVGRGAGFREQAVWNVPTDNDVNNRRFHEAVSIIQKAWSGEEFTHEGEFWQFPPLIVAPQPERQPAPIWVGSASIESALWAAEQGLPYATITWPLTALDHYKEKWDRYRERAAEVGTDISNFDTPYFLFLYCHEDEDVARSTAYEAIKQFSYTVEGHYEFARHASSTWLGTDFDKAVKNLEGMAQFPVDHHVIGTPETCIERIEWFRRELDVKYIVFNSGYGNLTTDQTRRSLQLFGERVLPHFTDVDALFGAAVAGR